MIGGGLFADGRRNCELLQGWYELANFWRILLYVHCLKFHPCVVTIVNLTETET